MRTTVRIKELRNRKGISQDELAERSGLSLRTIQRIENGKTEPLGDSLRKIANALEVTPEELVDWAIEEDLGFIKNVNLSALSFLFFPLLGIIVPYIIWNSKKGRIVKLDEVGTALINFQITWSLALFLGLISISIAAISLLNEPSFSTLFIANLLFMFIAYSFNLLLIVINTSLIQKDKPLRYSPSFKFL